MNERTIDQIKEIILAEKAYWDKSHSSIGLTGSGACCNILAAIYGHRAPWHPQVQPTACSVCPDDLPLMSEIELKMKRWIADQY